ncbi:unnamed protein product [Lepidochelys olivacea]
MNANKPKMALLFLNISSPPPTEAALSFTLKLIFCLPCQAVCAQKSPTDAGRGTQLRGCQRLRTAPAPAGPQRGAGCLSPFARSVGRGGGGGVAGEMVLPRMMEASPRDITMPNLLHRCLHFMISCVSCSLGNCHKENLEQRQRTSDRFRICCEPLSLISRALEDTLNTYKYIL